MGTSGQFRGGTTVIPIGIAVEGNTALPISPRLSSPYSTETVETVSVKSQEPPVKAELARTDRERRASEFAVLLGAGAFGFEVGNAFGGRVGAVVGAGACAVWAQWKFLR